MQQTSSGASATQTGLGAPEGAEPPSRLGASPAIPSAEQRVRVILDCKWKDLQHALDMVIEARPMFDRCKDDRPGWGWFLGARTRPELFVRRTKHGYSATDTGRDSDGTATAAANGDLPVPQDCQARPEGIAQTPSPLNQESSKCRMK